MTTKQFNEALHGKHDKPTRVRTMEYMQIRGYEIWENPDPYGQDLIAEGSKGKFYVECEVKTVWKGEDFPFDSVQLPERKKKFFDKPTLFFVWNNELSNALLFKSNDIKDLTPVEVRNKYVASGEMFYQIPLTLTGKVRMNRYETNT
jgi:hypothetical protein